MPLITLLLKEYKDNKNSLPIPVEWIVEELAPNFDVEEWKSQSSYQESDDDVKRRGESHILTVSELKEAGDRVYGKDWMSELELGKKYEMENNNHCMKDAVNVALENMKSNNMYYSKAMQMIDKPEEVDISTTGSRF